MKRWMLSGPNWEGEWRDTPAGDAVFDDDAWDKSEWVTFKGLRGLLKVVLDKPGMGFGADEYGNPSVYFRCGLFGIVFFYGRCTQTEVEVPELGENTWIDKVMYGEPE